MLLKITTLSTTDTSNQTLMSNLAASGTYIDARNSYEIGTFGVSAYSSEETAQDEESQSELPIKNGNGRERFSS